MMQNSNSIGSKIVTARKDVNLSQAELAKQLSISSQAVGKWERGESMPDIATLNRLAAIFGVDLNYFSEAFKLNIEENALETKEKKSVENATRKLSLNWDMSKGNWVDADFSGLKNLHDQFNSSNMKNCQFIGSDLSALTLKGNNIDTCNFSNSDFKKCQIQYSNLSKNLFVACSLQEAEIFKSYLSGCNFTAADFNKANIKSGGIEKCEMANAILKETSFRDTHLSDLTINGIVENCRFEQCDFHRVTFQNATLVNTFFKNNKKMNRVKFIDCKADNLTYAFLKNDKADLTGITLLS